MILEQYVNDIGWQAACTATCDKALPATLSCRVAGDDIQPSAPFTLAAADGVRERLVVDGASKTASTVGVVALVAGPIFGTVGPLVALAAVATPESPPPAVGGPLFFHRF